MNLFWRQMFIERDGHVPPVRQIAYSIRHAIATNRLEAGETLPSVRQLAGALDVTPATVGRAYAMLRDEGLLQARSGSATVVADVSNVGGAAQEKAGEVALDVIGRAVDSLAGMGLTLEQIRTVFNRKLQQLESSRDVVFVAGARPVVEKYRRIVEQAVEPAGFRVHACTLDELRNPDPGFGLILDGAVRLVCMLSFKQSVEAALRDAGRSLPVSVLLTEITMATASRLSALNQELRVLLVAEPEYRSAAAGLVRFYAPEEKIVVLNDASEKGLSEALSDVDVVVHTLGCSEIVAAVCQPYHHVIELEYYPRRDALDRILAMLVRPAVLS